jgi:hypothetical protein
MGFNQYAWRAPWACSGLGDELGVTRHHSRRRHAGEAPPQQPRSSSDVHGFFVSRFKNDYITPRGLLVTNTGLTTQVLSGLALDLYKDKGASSIRSASYGYRVERPHGAIRHSRVGSWNEFGLGRRHDREVRAELEVRRGICPSS